jgi:hypothetical protein
MLPLLSSMKSDSSKRWQLYEKLQSERTEKGERPTLCSARGPIAD